MQQLSSLDAVFLSMETPETPGHIGGLAILDPATHPEDSFDFERFAEFGEQRLALCPRFAWKLQEVPFGLDLPYWIEDPDFDFRRHLHRLAVPSPGGHQELAELASHLFARSLDRRRPLWEMYFVEGLQGGRVALLWKIHHCLMDGASGAGLVEQLFDLEPSPAAREPVAVQERFEAGSQVGLLEMLSNAIPNAARRPRSLLRSLGAMTRDTVDQLRTHGLSSMTLAPRTSINGVLASERSVAWSRISLERVKQLKRELDVTVNDVVLALTSEAVRRYLSRRGELPEQSLVASVPISLRAEDDKSLGNQVADMNVSWATDVEDPIERIFTIHEASMKAKAGARGDRPSLLGMMGEGLAPGLLSWLSRHAVAAGASMPLPANAVVSNVPMTPCPLYIAGAKIEGLVPMSLLAPTQGVNITVISYNGEMHFGVLSAPNLVDNVWELADAIPKALVELEEAVERNPRFSS